MPFMPKWFVLSFLKCVNLKTFSKHYGSTKPQIVCVKNVLILIFLIFIQAESNMLLKLGKKKTYYQSDGCQGDGYTFTCVQSDSSLWVLSKAMFCCWRTLLWVNRGITSYIHDRWRSPRYVSMWSVVMYNMMLLNSKNTIVWSLVLILCSCLCCCSLVMKLWVFLCASSSKLITFLWEDLFGQSHIRPKLQYCNCCSCFFSNTPKFWIYKKLLFKSEFTVTNPTQELSWLSSII